MAKRQKTNLEMVEETATEMWRRSAFRTLTWWVGAVAIGLLAAWALTLTSCTTPQKMTPQEIAASCPKPVFENRTDEPRTAGDLDAMAAATLRCAYHYPYSPCLITFVKVHPQAYHAICGVKR